MPTWAWVLIGILSAFVFAQIVALVVVLYVFIKELVQR